jgi:hypothetical protein
LQGVLIGALRLEMGLGMAAGGVEGTAPYRRQGSRVRVPVVVPRDA